MVDVIRALPKKPERATSAAKILPSYKIGKPAEGPIPIKSIAREEHYQKDTINHAEMQQVLLSPSKVGNDMPTALPIIPRRAPRCWRATGREVHPACG